MGVFLCRGPWTHLLALCPLTTGNQLNLRPRGAVPTWHEVWPVWGRAPERGPVGTALSHPLSAPTALARAIKSVSRTQSKPRSSTVSPQERPPQHWPGFGPQNGQLTSRSNEKHIFPENSEYNSCKENV